MRFNSLCKLWLDDCCPKTKEECDLVHAESVVKEPQLCKRYFSSKCLFEKACTLMHETYPCAEFFIERCDESDCKFSHASLDDLSRSLVKQVMLYVFELF